ncbi:MAG: L-histidine N(alpha)-methyltransferase [Candidatus Nitrosotalea sp.]|nr:L-histidine N(alpha)-methyltransferase [Candidatus Nitrosotalea sp.]
MTESRTRNIGLKKNDQKYTQVIVNPRFCYVQTKKQTEHTFPREIFQGLQRKNKFIHPKFFYDEMGSCLFEKISTLDEYYLTRAESEILDTIKDNLSKYLRTDYSLIEFGSGSALKTRKLLEALTQMQDLVEYYPIDISDILKESSLDLQKDYLNLKITGIIDHYESGLDFVASIEQCKLFVFLGSSLGNFDSRGAIKFLRKIHDSMKKGDYFLVGLDLVKDRQVLERAYDDSMGITAKFNLNLLTRINKEFGGNFDLKNFEHVSFFNEQQKRIEMHIQSKVDQEIWLSQIDVAIKFKKGEMILTEYSHKYTVDQIYSLAKKSDFKVKEIWKDKNEYFSLVLLSP